MKNVKFAEKNGKLMIEVDLKKTFGKSKSGKSEIIATTGGNIPLPGGEYMGLNIYKKVD
jgi:hypothetical protein